MRFPQSSVAYIIYEIYANAVGTIKINLSANYL